MDLVAIGIVRTAWGVKGWIKLTSLSGEWDHFADLEEVTLRDTSSGRTRKYPVENFRMHQGMGMFKLAGIDSPEDGKLLAGREILVDPEFSAPLGKGEWYLRDLIGLQIIGTPGSDYGKVVGVIESSDDLLEVERPSGGRFFIPFRAEFVGKPDLKKGVLKLKAPWLAEE